MNIKLALLFTFLLAMSSTVSYAQIYLDSTEIQERVVVSNLEVPWDMTYSPDGWIWFTELSGRISRVHPDTGDLQLIHTVEDVEVFGFSAGMHSIVLHPDFEQTPHVFVHYLNTQQSSKIVRYTYDAASNTLIEPTDILIDIPGGDSHNGSRMLIDDNKLYIPIGDGLTTPDVALDLNTISGKFLRMNLDGSVPEDNPIAGSLIWSWGHRNPQGFCKGNGRFYSSEHGTSIDDEINIIEGNRNYGWPEVEGFCDTEAEEAYCASENVAEPIWAWTPAIAPCGLAYYNHEAIPEWQNSLLLTVLKNRQLILLKLNEAGDEVVEQQVFLDHAYGRLRDVLTIPDGRIFVCTTNRDFAGQPSADDDKIIELKSLYTPVSTKSPLSDLSLNVYPNPTQQYLYLTAQWPLQADVEVLDAQGAVLLQQTTHHTKQTRINIEGLSPAVYYLKVNTKEGSRCLKFVVSD